MKFSISSAAWVAAVLSLGGLTSANPVTLGARKVLDVYVPPVTSPTAGTVWKIGEHQRVTWDASNPPVNITDKHGKVMLRKGNLITPLYLARGFLITNGSVDIQVPDVEPDNDYSIVLFGDSGNNSEMFTITD